LCVFWMHTLHYVYCGKEGKTFEYYYCNVFRN
jgi:hypothetical protein